MNKCNQSQVSNFCLEGRFLDLVIKDGYKLKGLKIDTVEGEYYVKLAKNLRVAFNWHLPPGTWLQIVGEKKLDPKTGEVKLKAERVMATTGEWDNERMPLAQPTTPSPTTKQKTATILMCQKSDCMKRGGTAVCQALTAALDERDLQSAVTIKGTGCMKNCKGGPNLVMPDKTRYSRIQAAQVPALIDKHFPAPEENEQPSEITKPAATTVANFSEVDTRVAV